MKLLATAVVVSLLAQLGGGTQYTESGGNPVFESCLVRLPIQAEVRIPAQEAGVLVEMPMKEGSLVKKGELVAVIDDREASARLKIAEYGLKAAIQRAKEDIEILYAQAVEKVAEADLEQDRKANLDHPGAIPETEMRRKKLDLDRARLQIDKAKKDQTLAKLEARTKAAERDAAKEALEWRRIYAPFDGVVVNTYRQKSEWVNPGDPILKLVRLDVLHIEVFASAAKYDGHELLGKDVVVKFQRARGREVSKRGKVVYVDPRIISDGSYMVRAEIENEREGDFWLLQPGVEASMTILVE